MEDDPLVNIGTKVPASMRRAIEAYCRKRGATVSNTVRLALERFLAEEGFEASANVGTWGGQRRNSGKRAKRA